MVTGAVAPDVRYLALGLGGESLPDTHSWHGLLWWCLPVALCYAWVVRRSIGIIAAHLPDSRRFAWRDYTALAHARHAGWITVTSALLGSVSHLAWDWLTHTDGWLRVLFGVHWYEITGVAWWTVSDLTSTVVGAVVTIGVAARIGQRRVLLAEGNVSAPPAARRAGAFWAAAGVVAAVGLGLLPFVPGAGFPAATGVRLLHVVAVALIAGAVATRISVKWKGVERSQDPTRASN